MKPSIISFLIVQVFFSETFCQTDYEYLDQNNVIGGVSASGDLFNDDFSPFVPRKGMEAPKNSQRISLELANIWIAGINDTGAIAMACPIFPTKFPSGFSSGDFLHGPIADHYVTLIQGQPDSSYDNKYRRVWKISREE